MIHAKRPSLLSSTRILCRKLVDGADVTSARLWIVDTLTSAERTIAARRLAAVRPVVAALAGIAAPEAFAELCRRAFGC